MNNFSQQIIMNQWFLETPSKTLQFCFFTTNINNLVLFGVHNEILHGGLRFWGFGGFTVYGFCGFCNVMMKVYRSIQICFCAGPLCPIRLRGSKVVVDEPLELELTKGLIFVRDFFFAQDQHKYLYAVGDPENDMVVLPWFPLHHGGRKNHKWSKWVQWWVHVETSKIEINNYVQVGMEY